MLWTLHIRLLAILWAKSSSPPPAAILGANEPIGLRQLSQAFTTTTTTGRATSNHCLCRKPRNLRRDTPAKHLHSDIIPGHFVLSESHVCRAGYYTPPRNISARFAWPLVLRIRSATNHSAVSLRFDRDRSTSSQLWTRVKRQPLASGLRRSPYSSRP